MFKNTYSFHGRLNRSNFFFSSITLLISTIIIFFLFSIILWDKNNTLSFICYVFVAFNFYRIKLSLMVKRSQDFGKKGQDSYLVSGSVAADSVVFVASLLVLFFKSYDMNYLVYIIFGLSSIISAVCQISLTVIKGDEGENDFGKPQIPLWKKINP
ncbi:DUF805 domain-containing protein [Bibersteinia trehalosi]|nr:DUF805 domain-containing protein [Bibersteinia trehalosi]